MHSDKHIFKSLVNGRTVLFPFLISLSFMLFSQSDPATSHHHINSFLINPALAGAQEGIDITAGYRYQWTGIDGAPQTTYLFSDALLPSANSGIGLGLSFDKTGAYTFTKINAAYTYRIAIGTWVLSTGLNTGITLQGLDGSKLITPDGNYGGSTPDHQDDILPTDKFKSIRPEFGLGIAFILPGNIETGISLQNLIDLPTKLKGVSAETSLSWGRTLYIHGKAKINTGKNFSLIPSLLLRTDFNKFQIDLLAILDYKDFLFAGLGYRGYNKSASGSLIPMIGFAPVKKLQIFYSYDVGISALKKYGNGSHELSLKYTLPVNMQEKKPKATYNPRFL